MKQKYRVRSLKNRAGSVYYRHISKVEQMLSAIDRAQQAKKNRLIEKVTNKSLDKVEADWLKWVETIEDVPLRLSASQAYIGRVGVSIRNL